MLRVFLAALVALSAAGIATSAVAQSSVQTEQPHAVRSAERSSSSAVSGAASSAAAETTIPPVVIEQPEIRVSPEARKKRSKKASVPKRPAMAQTPRPVIAESDAVDRSDTSGEQALPGTRSGSLTVPTTAEAFAEINQTPGGVALVQGNAYQEDTPAKTPKDILDYVPGAFAQPKWGEDSRLSIRGSGLSRNFHLRSIQLYMDGIPMNTSDGYGDFQEIDPTVYKYVEVYKGANALRYGANSLGGAINFVMPTGYSSDLFAARTDFGSFGFHKLALSSGATAGRWDYFVGGTWQEEDGYRDHSSGESVRGSANIGLKLSPNVETRFYLNANEIQHDIPGDLTKHMALSSPKTAAPINVINDWQRNIDSVRFANKTAIRLGTDSLLEVGAFGVDRHLMHPIFLWLDYQYNDYGGFARLFDESRMWGHRNLLVAGVNVINGDIDADLFGIGPSARKGPLIQSADQRAENTSLYIEDSFYFLPKVALVGGTQFLYAARDQEGILNTISGSTEFDIWSPKVGLLWDVDPKWQVFANISRSAEVPSFGEGTALIPFTNLKAQRATTYEIGTRGQRPDFTWDIALYHAAIHDELQCLGDGTDFCSVVNLDRTVHQGLELGFGVSLLKSVFVPRDAEPDRLWLNSAYTFNDFYFDDDPIFGDNEIPGIPRHYLRAELLYKHPSGFFAGPNVEWVPEAYFVDNANTLDTKAYALLDAKLGFERGRLTGYIEGRNLSDENYIATTDIVALANPNSTLFWPGNGRAVHGGLRVKW
jgi:iron complex outermembrane recepter protein